VERARGQLRLSARTGSHDEAIAAPGSGSLTCAFGLVTVAEWIAATALSVHAFERSGALAVGLLGFRFVPAGLASVAATRLGELRQPQDVMAACASIRAGLVAIGGVGLALGWPLASILAARVSASWQPRPGPAPSWRFRPRRC